MQVYVLTKGWRFRAVTLLQYTQSQVGSRKRLRQEQQRQLADGEAAASPRAPHDVETASHKATVVPRDDSSSYSSVQDNSLASKPNPEQLLAGLGSQQALRGLPELSAQSAEGSRKGPAGVAAGRPATIIPHPGGPGGRWEDTQKDSSRSLAASSAGSVGKTAVVVPEAARFAALKSATLWRQLVRRQIMTARKLHTVLLCQLTK